MVALLESLPLTCSAVVFRLLALLIAALLTLPVRADAPPKLSDLNILRLQNALLTRDLAQARLDALVRELTVPGYELQASGDYIKATEKEKP